MLPYLRDMTQRATHMFRTVAVIMAPVMLLVYVGERLGWVAWLGRALAPAMQWLNLPAEAALVWATTVFAGMYAGMAAVASLSAEMQLTTAQMTALASMMLFAHNLPIEQAVVRRTGANAWLTGALRLLLGGLYGAAIAWICHLGGWLQEPVSLAWLTGNNPAGSHVLPDFGPWLLGSLRTLLLLWGVIIVLVVFLDALERLGVTRLLTRALAPILRISGLDARAAPLVTTGMLIGLTYGGALIIGASEKKAYDRRSLLLSMCWLSLFHAVFEDTLLMLALGADIWLILVLRGVVTLAVMMALAALTGPNTAWGKRLLA